jgi:hypothetical protein
MRRGNLLIQGHHLPREIASLQIGYLPFTTAVPALAMTEKGGQTTDLPPVVIIVLDMHKFHRFFSSENGCSNHAGIIFLFHLDNSLRKFGSDLSCSNNIRRYMALFIRLSFSSLQ